MVQVQKYREGSRTLLNQAYAELAAGDTRQASEKGWGATAQMLKAIAQERNLNHRSHGGIRQVAEQLTEESGNERIADLFSIASDLHTNWYENWDSPSKVGRGIRRVEELLAILADFLPAEETNLT